MADGERQKCLFCRPSLNLLCRQPSAVSRQPSAVSRQPSAVSRQPSIRMMLIHMLFEGIFFCLNFFLNLGSLLC